MTRPTLTVGLANYGSTYPPGEWHRFVDLGRAAEDAGVDRIVVVDHVVMGPHTENYVWGKFPVPPEAPWFEPLTMLARDRGGDDARAARDRHPHRAAAAGRVAREAGRDARRDVAAAGSTSASAPDGSARSTTREGLDFEQRGQLLTTRSPRARCCGATRRPRSTRRRSRSATSTASRSRCSRAACRCGSAGTLHRRNLDRIVRWGDAWIPIMGEIARRASPTARARIARRVARRPAATRPALQVQAPLRIERRATTAGPTSRAAWRRCPSSSPRARPTCT